jgi:hypothetical protein
MALKLSIPRENESMVPSKPSPTLGDVAPDWVEAVAKLVGLNARREELIAKIPALKKAMAPGLALYEEQNIGPPPKAPEPRKASAGAAALLGSKFTPPAVLPEPVGQRVPPQISELRKISGEIAQIDEALAFLQPQLTKVHLEGSARLCELLLPEYRVIAGRICAALVELGRAHVEHDQFMKRHRSAVKAKLRPIHGAGSLGDPRDAASELRRLLEWAIECGHFSRDQMPKEWERASAEIFQWPGESRY